MTHKFTKDDVGKRVNQPMFGPGIIAYFDPDPSAIYPVVVDHDTNDMYSYTDTGCFDANNPYPNLTITEDE